MSLPIVIILDLLLVWFFFGNSLTDWCLPPRLKALRRLKNLRKQLRLALRRHGDIITDKNRQELLGMINRISALLDNRNATLQELQKTLDEVGDAMPKQLPPPKPFPWLAENIEVIVVSVGVAFSIRSLLLQPFKIPTGSMQPTLYGIHYTPIDEVELPGKASAAFQYLNYSRRYFRADAPERLTLDFQSIRPEAALPLLPNSSIAYRGILNEGRIIVPATVVDTQKLLYERVQQRVQKRPGLAAGSSLTFDKGENIFSGAMEAGDHLFVNRLSMCFKNPVRGDVMVFHTRGLQFRGEPLAGDYYIKRLVGMPGDTLKIIKRQLWFKAAGEDSFTLMDEKIHPGFGKINSMKDGYRGYATISSSLCLRQEGEEFVVPEGCYFMLGDNTENSLDSRFWGVVPRANLVGRPCFVWWPFTKRFGLVN